MVVKYHPVPDDDNHVVSEFHKYMNRPGKIIEIDTKKDEPHVPIEVQFLDDGDTYNFNKNELVILTGNARILYGSK